MSFEVLEEVTERCAALVPAELEGWGSLNLLKMARSLFLHAWFDYEFMVLSCLVGLQAVEAGLREIYPDAEKVPFRRLVRRARDDGYLPPNIADLAHAAAQLRNRLSHPRDQAAFTIGMAAPVLENTHRLVVLLIEVAPKAEVSRDPDVGSNSSPK